MTSKSITQNGKIITVEIEHKVVDKTGYADGYNINTGREVYNYMHISIKDESGKLLTEGKELQNLYPMFDSYAIAKGAVAKVGKVYLSRDSADAVAALIKDVEAETPKSAEQLDIEAAAVKAEKDYEDWYNSPSQVRARALEDEMDRADSDL